MSLENIPFLLVTANVGSIFEEPNVMLKIWTKEFLSTIARLDPKFVALHCQEVGGKNYAESMRHVEDFVRLLINSEELRLFDKVRVFLDEDFSSAEHFTALGNLYFVHETLKDVHLWDFKDGIFVPVSGQEVHSGNIEAVTTKEKAKFPQDFFPECKWSRKGFLRTRWNISDTVFDLINIHLFHDASNFIAMETFPSVYSKTRRRALEHTLDRFHNDHYPNAPYFLFGDFNFRTDTAGVIKKLTADTRESKMSNKGALSKLQFRNESDDLILTLGKKEFSHHDHQQVFVENSGQWLREYDKELGDFKGRLFEFPIHFMPSYPFEEDVKEGTKYMLTRVPAWCDRILLSPSAKSLVKDISPNAIDYGIIGPCTCMGDHKPVYLRVMLASDAGMIDCCSSKGHVLCFRVPESYLASEHLPLATATASSLLAAVSSTSLLPNCRSCARAATATTAGSSSSSNLLHAASLKHDPYTPDSMDSPSPNVISSGPPDIDSQFLVSNADGVLTGEINVVQSIHKSEQTNRAVSPALLKSKLELIVEKNKRDTKLIRSESVSGSNSDSEPEDNVTNDQDWCIRKIRSNSDVSWQRSHLLTQAWLQGKSNQAYHSFSSNLHHIANDHEMQLASRTENYEQLQQYAAGLTIPRIAIINASNFESSASSVHLYDDVGSKKVLISRSSQPSSDQYLDSLYANTRTRSLSEIDSNQDRRSPSELIVEENELRERLEEEERHIEVNRESIQEHELQKKLIRSVSNQKKVFKETQLRKDTNIAYNDAKPEATIASKSTTRSNSIHSQEANVSLKLKAYNKVTERYKRNIVGKKGRCNKCCVVS